MLHISFKTRIIFFILLLKQSVIDLIANVLRMCLFVFCSFCFALNSIFSQNYSIRVESITIIVGHDQASWKRASILCFLSNSKQNLVPLDQRVFVFVNAFCDKNYPQKKFCSFFLAFNFFWTRISDPTSIHPISALHNLTQKLFCYFVPILILPDKKFTRITVICTDSKLSFLNDLYILKVFRFSDMN